MTDLQALIARPDWMALAECRGMDVSRFYPDSARHADIEYAQAICAECPVRDECAQYARDNHEIDGIWGGRPVGYRRARGGVPKPIEHGTIAGAAAHRRRGERPCDDCLRASARYAQASRPSRATA